MTNPLRLNKLLARYGFCSRRQADEWILAGRVAIDGIVCREVGTLADPQKQHIVVDGRPLEVPPEFHYLAMNKPVGIVTTRDDPQRRPTVMSLLPANLVKAGVFPVGRLDADSEGLLLLTNDGDWGQILVHPRHQIWKEYFVCTDQPLTPAMQKRLTQGLELDKKKTLPAKVKIHTSEAEKPHRFLISIREGRNRQIRRMCNKLGLTVLSLQRVAVGPIELKQLKLGEWRNLSVEEIQNVFRMAEKPVSSHPRT